ncbi:MAG TPA: hypothetical protein VFI06_11785 [Chitinophagaceae bacterium]|nr:hypothetical protein [Chitinophagaceae bacterium]
METTLASTSTSQKKEQDLFRTISFTTLFTAIADLLATNLHFYFATGHGATLRLTGAEEPVSLLTYLTQGGLQYVFKYIAQGVFGPEAAAGGRLMIVWGAVFHFMISFFFTTFLFLIYRKAGKWFNNTFTIGIAYGIFTWIVMNLAVIPLSRIHTFPVDPLQSVIAAFILVLVIGFPVALAAHRFYSRRNPG